jgi:hypothetical protein
MAELLLKFSPDATVESVTQPSPLLLPPSAGPCSAAFSASSYVSPSSLMKAEASSFHSQDGGTMQPLSKPIGHRHIDTCWLIVNKLYVQEAIFH